MVRKSCGFRKCDVYVDGDDVEQLMVISICRRRYTGGKTLNVIDFILNNGQ